jgi:hypothetical protein
VKLSIFFCVTVFLFCQSCSARALTIQEVGRNLLFGEKGTTEIIQPTKDGGVISIFAAPGDVGAVGVAKFAANGGLNWARVYAHPGENQTVYIGEAVDDFGNPTYQLVANSASLKGVYFWVLQLDAFGNEQHRKSFKDLPYVSKQINSVRSQPNGTLLMAGTIYRANQSRSEGWIAGLAKDLNLTTDFYYPTSQLTAGHNFDFEGMFVDKNSDGTWTLIGNEMDRAAQNQNRRKGVWFVNVNSSDGKIIGNPLRVETVGNEDCSMPFLLSGVTRSAVHAKNGDYVLSGFRLCLGSNGKTDPHAWLFRGEAMGKRVFETLDRGLESSDTVISISMNDSDEILLSGMRVNDATKESGGFLKVLFPLGIEKWTQVWDSTKREPLISSDAVQDINGNLWTGGSYISYTRPIENGTVLYRITN